MSHSKLKQSLQLLQSEIAELKSISGTERKELELILRNIRQTLDSDENIDSNLQENLNSTIVRLEAAHPRLTAVLNDIMVTLGNMGI
jgi:hypothetical protein